MDLYTLDSGFRKKDVIDVFNSAIWTERYSSAGDVTLVVPANPTTMAQLSEGTFLAKPDSKEVMLLDTQIVEKGLLKVTGNTLIDFLRNRIVRLVAAHATRSWITTGNTPGQLIANLVEQMCITGSLPPGIEGTASDIPKLSIGAYDLTGATIDLEVPYGPLYDAIKTIAETYEVGMSLYLDWASESDYSLKFKTYRGRDLTSTQSTYPMVRFSSVLDSLSNPSELRSISGYKTHCWAYAPGAPAWMSDGSTGLAYVAAAVSAIGFDRRVMQIFVDGIDIDYLESIDPTAAQILLNEILTSHARNALANNNYTKVVDGEVVPQSEFQFGTHYLLGDIVELQGYSEIIQKARITEYIHSQDETGERQYPTVSIID